MRELNWDTSNLWRADVGVGWGSALSPVLSALVILLQQEANVPRTCSLLHHKGPHQRMLGNSSRGLSPHNKHRACVVPITTCGHRLWYFEGAKTKGVLKLLTSMQRKAACWITGAFCASPTANVESFAGLPPIGLHLLLRACSARGSSQA